MLAMREPDKRVKAALDFALLEDFDHLYRYADLLDMLENVNEIVEQVILLNDKMVIYGDERIGAYDHDVPDFWILKESN